MQIKFHIKEICNIPLKFEIFKCKIDHISCKFHKKTDGLYRGLQEAEKKNMPLVVLNQRLFSIKGSIQRK